MQTDKQELMSWLKQHGACTEGRAWVERNKNITNHQSLYRELRKQKKLRWLWWYMWEIGTDELQSNLANLQHRKLGHNIGSSYDRLTPTQRKQFLCYLTTKVEFTWTD